jgi:hypothetical protein
LTKFCLNRAVIGMPMKVRKKLAGYAKTVIAAGSE